MSKFIKLRRIGLRTEVKYLSWLADIVLVQKYSNKWYVCANLTKLNVVYHKDPYALSNIDCLIDRSSGYKTLSFKDAYSGYTQIKMDRVGAPKTTFMSNHGD